MRLCILYHAHCFDGAASAGVFARFFRERVSRRELIGIVAIAAGIADSRRACNRTRPR